jgi:hypothetical protein
MQQRSWRIQGGQPASCERARAGEEGLRQRVKSQEIRMRNTKKTSSRTIWFSLTALLALFAAACTKPAPAGVKKMPANQEYSGFLKDYSKLAPNPDLDGAVKTFVSPEVFSRRPSLTPSLPWTGRDLLCCAFALP